MKIIRKTGVAAALLSAVLLTATASAADMLMLIPDVPGNSRIVPDGIDVSSFSHGVANAISISGGAVGRPSFSNLQVSKQIDKATPLLYKACASGQRFDQVQLFVRHMDGDIPSYYIYTLKEVMVSSCQSGGSNGTAGLGEESVTLDYQQIQTDYLGVGGPVSFNWDLAERPL